MCDTAVCVDDETLAAQPLPLLRPLSVAASALLGVLGRLGRLPFIRPPLFSQRILRSWARRVASW